MDVEMNWKNVSLIKENVDCYLKGLYDGADGQFINLKVCFDKDDLCQIDLLRLALLEPQAFSGLCKQLLAHHFSNRQQWVMAQPVHFQPETPVISEQSEYQKYKSPKDEVKPKLIVQEKQIPPAQQPPTPASPVATQTGFKKKPRRTGRTSIGLGALFQPNPDATK